MQKQLGPIGYAISESYRMGFWKGFAAGAGYGAVVACIVYSATIYLLAG